MEKIKIYTDGSCNPNPGKGGWAFAISKDEYRSGSAEHSTNNIMEMTAIAEAIAYAKHEFPMHEIEIYSDSQYCVNGFNSWMHTWQKKGWKKKGGPIMNLELWKNLWDMREDVKLIWVKGHEGNEMNEFVDILATGGDPNDENYKLPERLKPEWEQLFKELTKWMKGGWRNEDRDSLLRRLQNGYELNKKN